MKKVLVSKVVSNSHRSMNDTILHMASMMDNCYLVIKLDDLLQERGISQKDLAMMTGIREGTITEIANGKGSTWNKTQLIAIMSALKLTALSQLIEIRLDLDTQLEHERLSDEWTSNKEMPIEIKEQYTHTILKSNGLL